MSKTVPFQTIQFSINMQFKCKYSLIVKNISIQFDLTHKYNPYQVLPLGARVDLGAMAMKGYSVFPKAPASLETHHQIV